MRSLWTVLDVALALVFLSGFAALYVPPRAAWGLQAAALALPLCSVFVVVALGISLANGRTPTTVLHGVLAILAMWRFFSPQLLYSETDGGLFAKKLSVLSFNAQSGKVSASSLSALHRLTTSGEAPEVIALQEAGVAFTDMTGDAYAHPHPRLRSLTESLPNAYRWARLSDAGHARILITPILIRNAELGTTHFTDVLLSSASRDAPFSFDSTGGDPWREPLEDSPNRSGVATRLEFTWERQRVAIYNVHLRSFDAQRPWTGPWRERLSPTRWLQALRAYRTDLIAREEEARALRRLLDAETLPTLLVGDLNSTPHQWLTHHLRQGRTDMLSIIGIGRNATFPAALPLVRIDAAMADTAWRPLSAEVRTDIHSDHCALVVRTALR